MTKPNLDPQIAAFVASMRRAWADYPPFMTLPLPEARVIAERIRAPWTYGGPEMDAVFDRDVPTSCGPVRIRIFDPGIPKPAGILIYIHGGGWTLFSLDTHDRLMREYADAAECLVVGVDYPLSPEMRYPIALTMVVDLIDWLIGGGAAAIGGDPARIAIGGDSAGGNLSIAAALKLRDRGQANLLNAMLLNYGAFTEACSDEAEYLHGGPGSVMDRAEVRFYFDNYLGDDPAARSDPYAVPLAAGDLTGLPPAFLVIPECDILSEQSFAMAERLRAAGVPVESEIYLGATHSFLEAMSIADVARRAIADGAAWLRPLLARDHGTGDD